jgi:signal peptidase I
MEPTYHHGDRVLVRRGGTPTPGQVVVVEQPASGHRAHRGGGPPAGAGAVPDRQWVIKRVAAVPGDPVPRERVPALGDVPEDRVPAGKLVLLGDNHDASLDSRRIGYFSAESILGAVLRPLSR